MNSFRHRTIITLAPECKGAEEVLALWEALCTIISEMLANKIKELDIISPWWILDSILVADECIDKKKKKVGCQDWHAN